MTCEDKTLLSAVRGALALLDVAIGRGDRSATWQAALAVQRAAGAFEQVTSYTPAGLPGTVSSAMTRAWAAITEGRP
ncbi:MAG TPA: hypothetical protein VGK67_35270 [Myxococcales bacterium]